MAKNESGDLAVLYGKLEPADSVKVMSRTSPITAVRAEHFRASSIAHRTSFWFLRSWNRNRSGAISNAFKAGGNSVRAALIQSTVPCTPSGWQVSLPGIRWLRGALNPSREKLVYGTHRKRTIGKALLHWAQINIEGRTLG